MPRNVPPKKHPEVDTEAIPEATTPQLSRKERARLEKEQRIKDCYAEIKLVLDKYDCKIVAQPALQNGLIVANVGIEAE